jgi:hypothetical protein
MEQSTRRMALSVIRGSRINGPSGPPKSDSSPSQRALALFHNLAIIAQSFERAPVGPVEEGSWVGHPLGLCMITTLTFRFNDDDGRE